MKFAEHLQAHLTPEWRTQYIDYEGIKEFLYRMRSEMPDNNIGIVSNLPQQTDYLKELDEEYFAICTKELEKIEAFFTEKLAEAARKFNNLQQEQLERKKMMMERSSGGSIGRSLHRLTSTISLNSRPMSSFVPDTSLLAPTAVGQIQVSTSRLQPPPTGVAFSTLQINAAEVRRRAKSKPKKTEKKKVRKLHDIKLAFSEFYLSLILLQNYQTLNFTGFRKILKKHDKLFATDSGKMWRFAHVDGSAFNTNSEVTKIIEAVENLYISDLEEGNRSRAMKRLRVPPLTEQQNPWTTFGVGFFLGMFAMMVIIISLALGFLKPGLWLWVPALRMFRGSILVVTFLFLMGINTYGWRSSGVNHVLIFEIDPRSHLSHHEIMQLAAFFSVLWGTCVVYTLTSSWMDTPPYAGPFFLFTFMAVYLLNPLHIFHYKSRRWVLKYLLRIFSAPFHSVAFADFWLADQLNSLVYVFLDIQFFVCFYATQIDWTNMEALASAHNQSHITTSNFFVNENGGICSSSLFGITPIIKCLPAWFRFAQCMRRYYDMKEKKYFPHVVNAGKYATTFLVVIFATLYSFYGYSSIFALWILASIFSTCYTYSWDILMDWGFFSKIKETGRRTILREDLVYRYKAYYYVAIVEDLILRLSWTVEMWLGRSGAFHIEILRTILALLEVFRRFVWNFFRLENEHLNNCGEFRAVRDIYIAPISRANGRRTEETLTEATQPLNRNAIAL